MITKRRYIIDGVILDIPLHYDEAAEIYIEEYPNFIENPLWTDHGNPIMFSGEDACVFAEEATEGGCPDCGSCKYYLRAAENTLIGTCTHENKRKPQAQSCNQYPEGGHFL